LFERRSETLVTASKTLKEANSEFREKMLTLNKETDKLRFESRRKEEELNALRNRYAEEEETRQRFISTKVGQLEKEVTRIQKERDEAQQHVLKVQQVASEQRKEKAQDDTKYREEARAAVLQLQKHLADYQERCLKMETELKYKEFDYLSVVQKLKHECEVCRLNTERVKSEKEAVMRRISAAENKAEQMKALMSTTAQESTLRTEEKDDLVAKVKASEAKVTEMTIACEALRSNVKHANGEILSSKKCNEDQRKSYQSKMEGLLAELSKEKKKSEGYKGKAMEAHKKTRLAKQTLERTTSIGI